ncbi:MAG: hypothetical protein IPG42_18610 [Betaproteobacteria bacterium]|jgi:tetratricopeptide (TPR) repeat protein|nr:hypothetical protein [Betaproteobacteria bacterium]MBP6647796.1 hypothetical protein [Burkholderiaceae bacterium]
MTGYLLIGFVLICVLVWLVIRSRATKVAPPASRRFSQDGGAGAKEEATPTAKWVDTIRRDGVPLVADDTRSISTQVLDQSTVREDASERAWYQSQALLVTTEITPKPAPIKAPERPVLSTDPSVIDNEISALHKKATQLKSKDWSGAISALEKAAILDAAHNRWNDMTRMVRLPTFLQQAGRFDEAMAEFERLIERVPIYVQEHAGAANELSRSATLHREYEVLYDKMRLACKREKQHELAEKYTQKSAVHREALGDLKELRKSKRNK